MDVLNEIHPSCVNDNDAVSTMVTDLENHVLNAFGNIMKNAEKFHDHHVFVGKNIFPICIRSMKKNLNNNNNMKPSWKYEPHSYLGKLFEFLLRVLSRKKKVSFEEGRL